MSHFTVLVITDQKPTDDHLSKVLMPWHEYECTGFKEYLQNVDKTDEVIETFNRPRQVVRLPDGQVFSRWDERFYHTPPATDPVDLFARKEFRLPEGAEEIEMPADEARAHGIGYATLEECAKEEYGAFKGEGTDRFYRLTNPNKKWDWWSLGGRWKGMLLVKPGTVGLEGKSGAFGNDSMREGGVDACQVKDLDIERMQEDAASKAAVAYDKVHAVIAGRPVRTWEEIREQHEDISTAREEFWGQPVMKDLSASKDDTVRWAAATSRSTRSGLDGIESYLCSRDEYIQKARNGAFSTFAVVKDGQWYQRGSMGWFGVVVDEKDGDEWNRQFSELVRGLSPETWVAVVDCHI